MSDIAQKTNSIRRSTGAAWRPIYWKKQTELETENK